MNNCHNTCTLLKTNWEDKLTDGTIKIQLTMYNNQLIVFYRNVENLKFYFIKANLAIRSKHNDNIKMIFNNKKYVQLYIITLKIYTHLVIYAFFVGSFKIYINIYIIQLRIISVYVIGKN